jgi:glycosyltransferase involved in cell wall biosynthesis
MNDISKKPKIAIITIKNSYKYGGVLTCVRKMYQFCQRYFDPTVFVLNFDNDISTSIKSLKYTSGIKKSDYFGMKCVEVGARWAFWEPGHYVYNLDAWKKVLQGYDYFFVKSGSCMCSYPLVQLNKKFVMWVGTAYEDDKAQRVKNLSWFRYVIDRLAIFKMRKIEREILEKATCILSISKNTKKRIEQILGKQRNNLMICNFPIQVKPVLQKHAKNVIAVGRFSDPRKNIDMLLRVFKKLHEKHPHVKLFVVGKKPNIKPVKNVIFTGECDVQEIQEYYEQSCMMLLTSFQEGLGIVGLEAMSNGIPVVATDCGGPKDYVINGYNGYLVKINDDRAMIKKALHILEHDDVHKKMSKNAVDFVEQNFSEKKIYAIFKAGLVTVYPELKEWFESVDEEEKLVFEHCNAYVEKRKHG